jgi:hypothetical protein
MASQSESDGITSLPTPGTARKPGPAGRSAGLQSPNGRTTAQDAHDPPGGPLDGGQVPFQKTVPAPSRLAEQRRARFLRQARTNAILVGGGLSILGAGAVSFVLLQRGIQERAEWVIGICVVVLLVALYSGRHFWLSRDTRAGREARASQDERAADRDDPYDRNQELLDKYYDLTWRHAATSHRNCQLAMLVGLILLVAGAVIAVRAKSGSLQLVVGALTALSSGLSAFLSKTFMRMHERALAQLNYYFGRPLVESYLLAAERTSGKLTRNQRDQALVSIIDAALNAASGASHALAPGLLESRRKDGSWLRRGGTKKGAEQGDPLAKD